MKNQTASLHERHLPYADGNANMKQYDEPDEKGRMRVTERRGDKTPIAEGRSVFETPEQRKKKNDETVFKNTDKVLRPRKKKA